MREKMKIEDRAKIFAPFDALKGFKEALREKERVITTKKILSEDEANSLSDTINNLKIGSLIKATIYDNEAQNYVEVVGIYTKIDFSLRYITIVKEKISFDDLYSIEILDSENIKIKEF